MASEQWLLNDASVASNALFTAVGTSYKLRNITAGTYTRRTASPAPYEGAGYYASGLGNEELGRFQTSAGVDLTGGVKYVDAYFYLTAYPSADVLAAVVTGDLPNILFTWIQFGTSGALSISSYDNVNGAANWTSSASSAIPLNAWFRIQYKTNASGINEAGLFKGANINGSTPDVSLNKNFATQYPFSVFGAYEYEGFAVDNTGAGSATLYADSIKLDTAAYPIRTWTVGGSATITASGTAAAAATKAIGSSSSATATGTADATVTKVMGASATATASGTGSASSTINVSASATITASPSAAAAKIITISAAGSAAASGSADALRETSAAGSATITATSSAGALTVLPAGAAGSATGSASGSVSIVLSIAGSSSILASASAGLDFTISASTINAIDAPRARVNRHQPTTSKVSRT